MTWYQRVDSIHQGLPPRTIQPPEGYQLLHFILELNNTTDVCKEDVFSMLVLWEDQELDMVPADFRGLDPFPTGDGEPIAVLAGESVDRSVLIGIPIEAALGDIVLVITVGTGNPRTLSFHFPA